MSALDQSFNNSSCCGSQETAGNPTLYYYSQLNHQSTLNQRDQRDKEEVDTLLSDALNNLSFEDRQVQQELVHGVNEQITENPTLIESRLQELNDILIQIKAGSTYEAAELMDKEYVSARSFRLMFLRAKRYDSKEAANQMLHFFDLKEKLFGRNTLARDITMEDLDEDDVECLRSGFLQLAGRDRTDRQVVLELPGLKKAKTPQNELRARFYFMMSSLENERNQLRGYVGIAWTIGEYREKENGRIETIQMAACVPIQSNAIHFCTDEVAKYVMVKMIVKAMPSKFRARFVPHFGSHLECSYRLSTYGISAEILPFRSGTNQVIMDYHLHWFQQRLSRETSSSHALADQPLTSVSSPTTEPRAADVLFIGGKKSTNPGNERLRAIAKAMLPAYTRGSKEKKAIVDGLIADIAKVGGRFLKKQKTEGGYDDTWEELDMDESRTKVMQMFRNLGRQSTASSVLDGTPITDQPRPDDVVFGNLQRSRGSQLLQQMITDRSKEYDTLDRGAKKIVVEAVMQTIQERGGRFLQELPEMRGWLEVPHDDARKRISKYFRNKRRRR